jgi:hypothetical protein
MAVTEGSGGAIRPASGGAILLGMLALLAAVFYAVTAGDGEPTPAPTPTPSATATR